MSWKCNLQHVVSLSTTQAEFKVVTKAIKKALWMKGMTISLRGEHTTPKVFFVGQSGIHLAKNQMCHERTKDIDVKLYFVREIKAKWEINLEKISTEYNLANS